jgi:hypothetical protein
MQDLVAVLEVLVGRRGADTGASAGLGDGKGIRSLFLDKLPHGLQELLLQMPVMIIFLLFYQCHSRLKLAELTFSFD